MGAPFDKGSGGGGDKVTTVTNYPHHGDPVSPVDLHRLVRVTNRVGGDWYGDKASCIFASGVLLDVLHTLGHQQARPVRVEAAARDRHGAWVVAGMRGSRATTPWGWAGHMGVLLDGTLLDPTLDQIDGKRPFSGPYAEDWEHAWYAVDPLGRATQGWTSYPGEGLYAVRYVLIRDREGWRGAPDWRRKSTRRDIANLVLDTLQTERAA
jgi:hypothetical protein